MVDGEITFYNTSESKSDEQNPKTEWLEHDILINDSPSPFHRPELKGPELLSWAATTVVKPPPDAVFAPSAAAPSATEAEEASATPKPPSAKPTRAEAAGTSPEILEALEALEALATMEAWARRGAMKAEGSVKSEPPSASLPAWEQPGSFLSAFIRTSGQMLLHPGRTLTAVNFPGYAALWAFALPWLAFSICVPSLYASVFGFSKFDVFTLACDSLIAAPLMFLLLALVWHFGLVLAQGNRHGFRATFRICAYLCSGNFLLVIPSLGVIFLLIWGFNAIFWATAAGQRIGKGRVLAVFFILLLIYGALVVASIMIIGLPAVLQMLESVRRPDFLW
jgi:hypothetical protein